MTWGLINACQYKMGGALFCWLRFWVYRRCFEPQIQGPTVWANHHATQARRAGTQHGTVAMTTVAMTTVAMTIAAMTLQSQPHRSKVMPTLRMLAWMLLSSQTEMTM